jgi:hypothetical protein
MVYLVFTAMAAKNAAAGVASVVRTYELLDRLRLGRDFAVRDDQLDFSVLLDAARIARAKHVRLTLLDTGRFGFVELEWLIAEGVRLCTSDEARPRPEELRQLLAAGRRGRVRAAYLQRGRLFADKAEGTMSLPDLQELGHAGLDVHVSNLGEPRDLAALAGLVPFVRKGGGVFVYYHHGRPEEGLVALAASGGWSHLVDRNVDETADRETLAGWARAARSGGAGAVLHVERGLTLETLQALQAAGAYLIIKLPPADRLSRFRPLEAAARRRKLPSRAFYLDATLLP